jgi:hypothetical protein
MMLQARASNDRWLPEESPERCWVKDANITTSTDKDHQMNGWKTIVVVVVLHMYLYIENCSKGEISDIQKL